MLLTQKKILFDCERMKYPNTGLFHFCLQLGKALDMALLNQSEQVVIYTDRNGLKNFDNNVAYLEPVFWHKWYLSMADKFSVWHAANQSTDYFPFHTKTPIVLTIHDLNFLYDANKNTEKQQRYLQLLQKKIDKASHIVAISNHVKNDILKYTNIGSKPLSVIYNGFNIAEISFCVLPQMVPSNKFIFTIGTVIEKKNFHVLPALLVNNDWQLIISGNLDDAAYQKKIVAEAEKYKVLDRIVFTGPISENDKQWYYQNCEAFVFPSLAEGFGLPVIEAMHFGKPVILSTCTSLPEIGGPHAYYFQDFEPINMQQTLSNSLVHYQQEQPQNTIKAWANKFNWQTAAKQYLNLYRSL